MAHNRQKRRLDTFQPEEREAMLAALWEATDVDDLEAWFDQPWHDGRNAVRLCLGMERRGGVSASSHPIDDPRRWLATVLGKNHDALTSEDYETAHELRYLVSRTDVTRYGVLLDAALSIYGNWIARSDGGGHVPNLHLSRAFGRLLYASELRSDAVHEAVGLWRARDVGLGWELIGRAGRAARRAAAHRWFWMNRRFLMAYAIATAYFDEGPDVESPPDMTPDVGSDT